MVKSSQSDGVKNDRQTAIHNHWIIAAFVSRIASVLVVFFVGLAPLHSQEIDPLLPERKPSGTSAKIAETDLARVLKREKFDFVEMQRDKFTSRRFVSCTIAGQNLQFLVDTGSQSTCLASELAASLKIRSQNSTKVISFGNNSQSAASARITRFAVGSAEPQPWDIFVIDLHSHRAHMKAQGAIVPDGILGIDWMVQHHCVIDLGNDVLYFIDQDRIKKIATKEVPGDQTVIAKSLLPNGFRYVPIRKQKLGDFRVNCRINGHEISLVLDTGYNRICISKNIAERLKLSTNKSTATSSFIGGKTDATYSTWVNELQIGDLPKHASMPVVMDLSMMRAASRQRGDLEVNGVIGSSWLSYNSCVVDLVGAGLFALNPEDRDRKLLSGQWRSNTVIENGVRLRAQRSTEWQLKVTADSIEVGNDKKVWHCTFGLAPLVTPGRGYVAVTIASTGEARTFRGLYQFDDSAKRLSVCLWIDPNRLSFPSKLESSKDSGTVLVEFSRP